MTPPARSRFFSEKVLIFLYFHDIIFHIITGGAKLPKKQEQGYAYFGH